MALVQRLKGGQKTSAKIAESLLSMALNEGTSSDRTDVVFDDCQDDSIKSAKRENRGRGLRSQFRNLQAGHQVKQWRKFLSSSRNKQALIVFVTKEWQKEKYVDKLSGKTLVVTCGREAYQFVIRSCWTSDWSRLISRRSGHQVTVACSSCGEIKVCCSNNRIRRYRCLGTVLGLQEFYTVLHVHQM